MPGDPPMAAAKSPAEGALEDAKKIARENYIRNMQVEFRNQGVDAEISEMDGQLIVVSDVLKLKPDRDRLMRTTFDLRYRKALCVAGFKTVALKSGVIFGDGDTYSLGCPETQEERNARRQAQEAERLQFANDLQTKLASDSEIGDTIQVEARGNELILTGPSVKGLPPKFFRSMVAAEFNDDSGNRLCSIGFSGFRVRDATTSNGIFIPLNCGASVSGGR